MGKFNILKSRGKRMPEKEEYIVNRYSSQPEDKTQEENKNCVDVKCNYYDIHFEQNCNFWLDNSKCVKDFKSANLLPTEKVCPECGGDGSHEDNTPLFVQCEHCKGSGTIQFYYTPEQYEKIMGKPYPDEALVWYKGITEEYFHMTNRLAKSLKESEGNYPIIIVQTAQPAPPADYRPEE
jgi:hypothetical protein